MASCDRSERWLLRLTVLFVASEVISAIGGIVYLVSRLT
jgi:hypothetical protein